MLGDEMRGHRLGFELRRWSPTDYPEDVLAMMRGSDAASVRRTGGRWRRSAAIDLRHVQIQPPRPMSLIAAVSSSDWLILAGVVIFLMGHDSKIEMAGSRMIAK
jgi:hypothetical protein